MPRPSYVLWKELLCYKRGAANMFPDYPLDFSTVLGDIGWIGNQGQFIRLFNCFEDGHRNKAGLPPNFAYLHIPDDKKVEIDDDLSPGEILCSPGTTILSLTNPEEWVQSSSHTMLMTHKFCSASETMTQTYVIEPCNPTEPSPHGVIPQYPVTVQHPNEKWAFLMSQYTAQRRYFVPNDLIHPYIIAHRENWFQLSVQGYHILHRDDFIFISGQVQTRAWALGICQRKDSVFKLVGEIADNAVRFRCEKEYRNNDCDARAGPERRVIRDKVGETMCCNPFPDQSIFLNFYKARTRLIGPAKISATSEPHSPSGDQDHDTYSNARTSSLFLVVKIWHIGYVDDIIYWSRSRVYSGGRSRTMNLLHTGSSAYLRFHNVKLLSPETSKFIIYLGYVLLHWCSFEATITMLAGITLARRSLEVPTRAISQGCMRYCRRGLL